MTRVADVGVAEADGRISPRIALIHALRDSVAPTLAAFASGWPQARTFNLLDDSLSEAVAAEGALSEHVVQRFLELGRYAARASVGPHRTDAILFTCSAFGPAIEAVQRDASIPVVKPNEGAFETALTRGRTIGLLVTFRPSLEPLTRELLALGERLDRTPRVTGVVVDGALAALQAGDPDAHDRSIAAAARQLAALDVLVLGQFSMARARAAIDAPLRDRVLTTPEGAVARVRQLLGRSGAAAGTRT